ncbi:MAG: Nif11-like leader peptide family natural product precursor [Xenococcaceae cyanobacterium MO_188.B32]|nr:Nif11-like leader peptide family natural product precursor [Xenococcaceae cyanobacterium MO_188.B32]
MSIENAKAFYNRMIEEKSFRTSLEAAPNSEERHRLIQDAGYDFTEEEWQRAIIEIQSSNADEEINEEELEAIAGGRFNVIYGSPWKPWPWPF